MVSANLGLGSLILDARGRCLDAVFLGDDIYTAEDNFAIVKGPDRPCDGDTNFDNEVNLVDLVAVLLAWKTDQLGPDVDDNCFVNLQDLTTVLLNWGNDCQ